MGGENWRREWTAKYYLLLVLIPVFDDENNLLIQTSFAIIERAGRWSETHYYSAECRRMFRPPAANPNREASSFPGRIRSTPYSVQEEKLAQISR